MNKELRVIDIKELEKRLAEGVNSFPDGWNTVLRLVKEISIPLKKRSLGGGSRVEQLARTIANNFIDQIEAGLNKK